MAGREATSRQLRSEGHKEIQRRKARQQRRQRQELNTARMKAHGRQRRGEEKAAERRRLSALPHQA